MADFGLQANKRKGAANFPQGIRTEYPDNWSSGANDHIMYGRTAGPARHPEDFRTLCVCWAAAARLEIENSPAGSWEGEQEAPSPMCFGLSWACPFGCPGGGEVSRGEGVGGSTSEQPRPPAAPGPSCRPQRPAAPPAHTDLGFVPKGGPCQRGAGRCQVGRPRPGRRCWVYVAVGFLGSARLPFRLSIPFFLYERWQHY